MLGGWFVKVGLFLAVLILVGFNAFTVVAAHLGTSDDARNAASAAASAYQSDPSSSAALSAADQALGSAQESVVPGSLRVLSNGDVRLTLRRQLRTLLLADIPYLKSFAVFTVTAVGAPERLP